MDIETERDALSARAWAAGLFARADLPDARLGVRLLDLMHHFASRPGDSIPAAQGDRKRTKACYRFLNNDRVEFETLLRAPAQFTAERCRALPCVLAVQDASCCNYTSSPKTRGLGPIDDKTALGVWCHTTIAVSPNGRLLGLLDLQTWTRDPAERGCAAQRRERCFEEKESFRWVRAAQRTRQLFGQTAPRPRLLHVLDREGDIHEFFAEILEHRAHEGAVVRAAQDRLVTASEARAFAAVAAAPRLGVHTLELPRCGGRPKRTAQLEVRACRVTLAPNEDKHPTRQPLDLNLIELRETAPPPGVEPVLWRLWTTEPATTLAEVLTVAGYYTCRWRIEEVHLTLKSGCQVEKLRFEDVRPLFKALLLYFTVAIRIVALRDLARATPDAPCTEVLTTAEWKALWMKQHNRLLPPDTGPPTLRQAVLWIGALAGHLNRKGDGLPGVRLLWRGWRDLYLLTDMYLLLQRLQPGP